MTSKAKGQEHKGIVVVNLDSWIQFDEFVRQYALKLSSWIYRGQRRDDWELESSLDRLIHKIDTSDAQIFIKTHLHEFKRSACGRRGNNPFILNDEIEWWSLGQHCGLASPLLDWTESPFIALFFAFEEEDNVEANHKYRSVWVLSESFIAKESSYLKVNDAISEAGDKYAVSNKQYTTRLDALTNKHKAKPGYIEIIRPHLDENKSLISQRGLFTLLPCNTTVEEWVLRYYNKDIHEDFVPLIKFRIANNDRAGCLKYLNRMNINHLSLFPNLYGASKYTNMKSTIEGY